jgi:hypothetical protein
LHSDEIHPVAAADKFGHVSGADKRSYLPQSNYAVVDFGLFLVQSPAPVKSYQA